MMIYTLTNLVLKSVKGGSNTANNLPNVPTVNIQTNGGGIEPKGKGSN
ncbi:MULTISPECIES: hypothetical protein [unclassified Pseudoalteromonas]|nr:MULTISPECIES: hypothetical protein [unclassified Pseudoalteromonas]MCF2827107.1 hypothetical protein [Pseudoalteromonas sp. OF5H-5]MCF2834250.1 hypothetical protein [Pseudoalteromonas sp. DL2-H6]MCF2925880.1 hypothetical protein [Pseudoalteromonas sp. DL2-H1]